MKRITQRASKIGSSTNKVRSTRAIWSDPLVQEEDEIIAPPMKGGKPIPEQIKRFRKTAEEMLESLQSEQEQGDAYKGALLVHQFDYNEFIGDSKAKNLFEEKKSQSGNDYLRGIAAGGYQKRSIENAANRELMSDPNAPEGGSFWDFIVETAVNVATTLVSLGAGKVVGKAAGDPELMGEAADSIANSTGRVGVVVTSEDNRDIAVGLVAAGAGPIWGTAIVTAYAAGKQVQKTKKDLNTISGRGLLTISLELKHPIRMSQH